MSSRSQKSKKVNSNSAP